MQFHANRNSNTNIENEETKNTLTHAYIHYFPFVTILSIVVFTIVGAIIN